MKNPKTASNSELLQLVDTAIYLIQNGYAKSSAIMSTEEDESYKNEVKNEPSSLGLYDIGRFKAFGDTGDDSSSLSD